MLNEGEIILEINYIIACLDDLMVASGVFRIHALVTSVGDSHSLLFLGF